MKKLLFSCLLLAGIGASAQYNYVGTFEDVTNVGQYGQFGGGTIEAAAACNGDFGGQSALSAAATQTGWMLMMNVIEEEFGQTNNGQSATVSLNYKKAAGLTGTAYVALFTQTATGSWNIEPIGPNISLTAAAITTCTVATGVIPAGKMQPGGAYGVGLWITRSGGTTGNVYVDDISIEQRPVEAAPQCTTFTTPADGGVVPAGTTSLTWAVADDAINYKVKVGTTSGGTDVFNQTVAGTSVNVTLSPGTTYYATVTPSNTIGDAAGCTEITFSTSNEITYCGPLTSTAPNAIAPIKSVNFADTTHTSDPTATTIGTFPVHQNFRDVVFVVKNDVSTLPITVQGTTNGNPVNGWAMSVFIDWNEDGDFTDAGESYFNTTPTMVRVANVPDNPVSLTGNITIPAGTTLGQKVMRVKYNFSGATIHDALVSACANMINGQAEDYTIDYQEALSAADVNVNKVSVYPNPFADVLKISDIKNVKSISITDVSGRTVNTLAPASELNLGHLKSGLYIVTLKYNDGSVKTVKAIKK